MTVRDGNSGSTRKREAFVAKNTARLVITKENRERGCSFAFGMYGGGWISVLTFRMLGYENEAKGKRLIAID